MLIHPTTQLFISFAGEPQLTAALSVFLSAS
jgi:hypothetical protein